MTKKILVSFLLISFLFVGVVQAQIDDLPDPGMLPDSFFYFLKSWSEGMGTLFTFGEVKKAERFLNLSEKRLAEAKALIKKDSMEHATRAIERYEEQLGQALQRSERGKEKGLDMDEVLERISEATLNHQGVLADVYEKIPEEVRSGIERVMENSMRGHEEALEAVSEGRREEAMERMETKREEARDRAEEARERGVDVPQIPEREEIEEETASEVPVDIPIEPGMPENLEIPEDPGEPEGLDFPNEVERPETPGTPRGRP